MSAAGHAICSASSAARWMVCPGSLFLSKDLPAEPSSPYAEEGSRAHALAERMFKRWAEKGRCLSADDFAEWEREYADTVTSEDTPNRRPWSMVDYVRQYFTVCVDQLNCFDDPRAAGYRVEHRMVLDRDLGMFGTADLAASGQVGGRWRGLVCDLKYGKGKPVSAEGNPQLAYYACALLGSSKHPLESVRVVVVQPRVLRRWYTVQDYTREELLEWTKRLRAAAEEALAMRVGLRPPTYATGGHCWFCPARRGCATYAAERASTGFTDVSGEEVVS